MAKSRSEYNREWRERNPTYMADYHKKWRADHFLTVIQYYSDGIMACACCGENEVQFLTIDHDDEDGASHRKSIAQPLYHWLIKNGFPTGYSVLCFNCNCARSLRGGGVCPHKQGEKS